MGSYGGKAPSLSERDEGLFLRWVKGTRHPERNTCMFLFSVTLGLRAIEISGLDWHMLLDTEGNPVKDKISIPCTITKGKSKNRTLHISSFTAKAIKTHYENNFKSKNMPVFLSERGKRISPNYVAHWFLSSYKKAGIVGCSSHSGRRTFITRVARVINLHHGSILDVMQMAGHFSVRTTQTYIESNEMAKMSAVNDVFSETRYLGYQ